MTRVVRILSLIFSALVIRSHHPTCISSFRVGRAFPLPPAGRSLVGPLTALRTPRRKTWELALAGLLVGLLGLLSWQGMIVVWSPPELPRTVAGAATRLALALKSAMSPALTHRGNSLPTTLAKLRPPTRDYTELEGDDLDDETSLTSPVVPTDEWLLLPLASASKATIGVAPPFAWPSRYLTRPQLLKRS